MKNRQISGTIGFVFVMLPLLCFLTIIVFQPIGSPGADSSLLIKTLDFMFSYWIREIHVIPPPLIVLGFICCYTQMLLNKKKQIENSSLTRWGFDISRIMLIIWALLTITPLLCHVN